MSILKTRKMTLLVMIVFCSVPVFAQTWSSSRTGVDEDGFTVNRDNSNHYSFLRLQVSNSHGWNMYNQSGLKWSYSTGGHGDLGTTFMTLTPNGSLGIGIVDPRYGLHLKERSLVVENNGIEMMINSTADGSYGWFGALTYHGLHIVTNNAPRMTFSPEGTVGIGTINPSEKLEVAGNVKASTLILPNTVAGRKIVLYSNNINDNQFFGLGINAGVLRYQVGDVSNDHVFFAGTSSSNSTELMRIKGNGNIGIGTSIPSEKLEISGNVKASALILPNTTANKKIVLYSSQGNDHQFLGFGTNHSVLRYQVAGTDNDHVFFAGTSSSSSTELMRIKGNGAVLIGDSAPSATKMANYNLWVKKGVVSEDFAVAKVADWSDFVFDEDYRLSPLQEVEKFILENKHLPGIQPENEIREEGYSLHEMNKKFLQKIEELTLYAIEQEKRIASLENELKQLKNQNGREKRSRTQKARL